MKNKLMYSSIQTFAKRTVLIPCVSRLSGNLRGKKIWGFNSIHWRLSALSYSYGWNSRKMCPTREQGIVSMVPPPEIQRAQRLSTNSSDWKSIQSLTLPNSEWHFQILSAPAIHLFIIAANIPEIIPSNGKQSSGHRWTVRRTNFRIFFALSFDPFFFLLRNVDPIEMAIPRKAPNLQCKRQIYENQVARD